MTAFSDYLENILLLHTFQGRDAGQKLTAIDIVYISLHTSDPTDTGLIDEVSGNNYGRHKVDSSVAGGSTDQWEVNTVGVGKQIDNDFDLVFATASGGPWGLITHFGIWDAVTTGNFLYGGAVTTQKSVQDGDTAKFLAGDLKVALE